MESFQRLLDVVALAGVAMRGEHWLAAHFLAPEALLQLAVVCAALAAALPAAARLRAGRAARSDGGTVAAPADRAAAAWLAPSLALGLVVAALGVAVAAQWPAGLLAAAAKLLGAWVVAGLLSHLVRSRFWASAFFAVAFAILALGALGLLEETVVRLDRLVFRLGAVRLSALDVMSGAVQFAALLWLALTAARLLDDQVQRADRVAPSLRVLTGKLLRFGLVAVAVVAALSSVGVDLTAFALFTGALGVALGFGMQKSTSNLISGLLLLVDRSIKPGDVLELSDPNNRSVQLFGWVTSLNARYVSLTTRDGTEWLVPNDELISNRIVNWSYSHNRVRLLTPIKISFDCDVPLAMRLAAEAARETPRVLADPAPVCRLMGFEDSAVNLELRFWIDDPSNGIINVRSDVLLRVWERFRDAGVRTALGHRDLHLKPGSELAVRIARGSAAAPR